MKFLTVDTMEEVKQKLLNCVSHWKMPVKRLEISETLGWILGEDIISPENIHTTTNVRSFASIPKEK